MERRIALRLGTSVEVACFGPASVQHASVQDISLEGCRLEIEEGARRHCAVGKTVILDLSGMAKVAGTVAWADQCSVGVRFDRPLDLNRYGILLWLEIKAGIPFEQLGDRQVAA